MKRRWKKAAAFLLALVMCVSLLPMNTAASDDEVEETPILTQAPMEVTGEYSVESETGNFRWTLPDISDLSLSYLEYRITFRETEADPECEVQRQTLDANATPSYFFTLYSDFLIDHGPGIYTFSLRIWGEDAQLGYGCGPWVSASVTIPGSRLPQPTDVHVTKDGILSWRYDAPDGIDYWFTVLMYRDGATHGDWVMKRGFVTTENGVWAEQIDDECLIPGSSYRFSVRANPEGGQGSYISLTSFSEETLVIADESNRLPAPTNLRWVQDEQMLRWDPVEGAAAYKVTVFSLNETNSNNYTAQKSEIVTGNAIAGSELLPPDLVEDEPTTLWFNVRAITADLTAHASSEPDHAFHQQRENGVYTSNRDELYHAVVSIKRPTVEAPAAVTASLIYQFQEALFRATWSNVPEADYYSLRVLFSADGEVWQQVYANEFCDDTSHRIPLSVLANGAGTYRVEVAANNYDERYTRSAWTSYDMVYAPQTTLSAPTGLTWDTDSHMLKWDAVDGADGYTVLIYHRYMRDSEAYLFSTRDAVGTSSLFIPAFSGIFSFEVAAWNKDTQNCAPALSDRTAEYELEEVLVGRPENIRLDDATGMIQWDAAENANFYEVSARRISNGISSVADCEGATQISLMALGLDFSTMTEGELIEIEVTSGIRAGGTTYYYDHNSLTFAWRESLLDPFSNEAGLIQLGEPSELQWGIEYDYFGVESVVPGLMSMRMGSPKQNSLKITIINSDHGHETEMSTVYWWISGISDSLSCSDFIQKCFDPYHYYDAESGTYCYSEEFPEGDYYFTAQLIGDEITYASGKVVRSGVWHYTPAPKDAVLTAPAIDSFRMEENTSDWEDETSLRVRWHDDANGENCSEYYVEFLFSPDPNTEEPHVIGAIWSKFSGNKCSVPDDYLQSNGNGRYYARVKAISSDITKWRHSPWSEMLSFDMRGVTEVVGDKLNDVTAALEEMPEATPQEVREAVQKAVQDMGVENMEAAMLTDQASEKGEEGGTGIIEAIRNLEEKAGGPAAPQMDTAASDKIKESFSLDKVAIVGASLNKKEEDTQDVALVIGSPKSEDVIPELYDSTLSIKFSMELVGVENSHALAVPVQVTLPIPSNINPMFLHILHYMQDGSVEEIWPFIYEKDGQYYAQMVLSSFSDFAIVVEKSYVDWDVDTQTGTLTVDVKVDPPTDQASWIVLAAYDAFGKMIDQTMQTLEAGSCQMQLTLSGEALGREGVTAKVIWLDSQFRPLSEAMVYPG